MEYNFRDIEKKWQQYWKETNAYKVDNDFSRPKCYVLDMFPYPSGAGLHVGHPLGYIASDIYARYKRLKGFNVLHPMGFDSFGLPAEQYALDTGQHPAVTTKKNIETFKSQLDNIGFCYDWSREVQTSDPHFYKWTQWIFLQLFNSYFCHTEKKALPISLLIKKYETKGAMPKNGEPVPGKHFTAEQWKAFSEKEKAEVLMRRRLVYCGYGEVNWCEALGTVLANDEVINGVSERGGFPVVKKTLRQWYLRITEYTDRLLDGLNTVDFSEAMKEMQSNWIGKSFGANIQFSIFNFQLSIEVFTTRPDTIFGVDFMVIAPEHKLVEEITTAAQKNSVEEYIAYVKSRSERERMADKKITGVFSGSYCIHPFSKKQIPVWISEYVLAGYGTGAIMAVPCGDERDHKFAKHFNIPITNIIGKNYDGEDANPTKDAVLENSDFLNGLLMKDAIEVAIKKIEEAGIGKRKVNYKMRDAAFSRQRYWGEPFPIIWKDGIAYPLDEKELPLILPEVDKYSPGPEGEGPLANIKDWINQFESEIPPLGGGGALETNTMPGYAGSSWYFLRYMDPDNEKEFCNRKVSDYWNQVDLYIGGTEHAVGHLLYSRMWTKFLFDIGLIGFDEPYKKLVNQGMIGGVSEKIIRIGKGSEEETNSAASASSSSQLITWIFEDGLPFMLHPDGGGLSDDVTYYLWNISSEIVHNIDDTSLIRVPMSFVDDGALMINDYVTNKKNELNYYKETHEIFLCKNGYYNTKTQKWHDYITDAVIAPLEFRTVQVPEKMSKRYQNVINPDDIIAKYGADIFRMYEMFLGPVEMSKPWDTKGIEGVHRFLKKFWRLFFDEIKGSIVTNEKATNEELKVLHKTIKKIEEDSERFSFNTSVSAFMIATNELTDLKCHKKEILESLLILLTPYAPHICEELWNQLGNKETILNASFPVYDNKYLIETSKTYPVAINGKTRTELNISLDATQQQVEEIVLADETVKKWLDGKSPKKIIYVKNKMINIVL